MRVLNIHEREFHAAPERVGALIDSLSSKKDALWPNHLWPRMTLDRPLGIGATGGHGPIRYAVEEYVPGRFIRFRFTGPKGFDGYHTYEAVGTARQSAVLRHTVKMTTHGPALLSWPLVFRPLHDALIEDSLATAQASLGQTPHMKQWPLWVRFLRWLMSGGKAHRQLTRTPVETGAERPL